MSARRHERRESATRCLVASSSAAGRVRAAADWLAARSPAEEVLIVAATGEAANDLIRDSVVQGERGGSFGWHRATLGRLAADLARLPLSAAALAPVGRLAFSAAVARVVHAALGTGALGRYADVGMTPGFPRAAAGAIEELRMARVDPAAVERVSRELAGLLRAAEGELAGQGLADRAQVFELATAVALDATARHPLLGLPVLLLDVPIETRTEGELVEALVRRSGEVLATVPIGDERAAARLRAAGLSPLAAAPPSGTQSLALLQEHLFEDRAPLPAPLGDDVEFLSAPGESRECVEIARRLIDAARKGTPFDRMAVLLRSVDEYRPHLEEAFARAGIPAIFARGAVRPDPAGRAFLALVACKAENLSARRFAEYLSLAVVPDAGAAGAPPAEIARAERWVAPDEEMLPEAIAEAAGGAGNGTAATTDDAAAVSTEGLAAEDLDAPVVAAVIGGRERWQRRLAGLEAELRLDLAEKIERDPDDPSALRLLRALADLASLRDFALPLLDDLEALPESADWGTWLDRLSALATRALREPERVLQVLAELAPMAPIGPVGVREVQLVLAPRLLEIAVAPPKSRYGRVFVAPAAAARGLTFDLVSIPGLAEKLFPAEIREEPLLLDHVRLELSPDLATNDERVRRERLALRIAVGAATRKLILSYPRLDLEKARPRVPSFYTLEAMRAAEGVLPGFDQLAVRAQRVAQARVGWPAPARPEDAIDEAEHDLALLDRVLRLRDEESTGTARYLLGANPHLGRALRFRGRRWLKAWTPADGLVEPIESARAALAEHQLEARSYSATALENYAACPYRFLLQAVHRLAPREEPAAIDEMDALQRGSLVHEVQFALLSKLQEDDLLPVTPANLERARAALDAVLDAVAERHHEELAPAIERVWSEGVAGVRADLREWLRRMSEDASGFVPWRFELAFGLQSQRNRDRRSQEDAVLLESGLRLRGSIDLVERDAGGRMRVTDHKTGKVRLGATGVVAGGTILQPVLYALATEALFPEGRVAEGRLSYCTAAGGFTTRTVALDERARGAARILAEAIATALREGFLPALPGEGACRWCDYRVVCGPYEELRARRKLGDPPARKALDRLRGLP